MKGSPGRCLARSTAVNPGSTAATEGPDVAGLVLRAQGLNGARVF